nr:hypothetical protein [Klebsiella pneumoniae]
MRAEGRSYRWIARERGISKNTVADIVQRHRANACPLYPSDHADSLTRVHRGSPRGLDTNIQVYAKTLLVSLPTSVSM